MNLSTTIASGLAVMSAEEVSQLRAEVVRLRHQLQESTEALQQANDTAEAWRKRAQNAERREAMWMWGLNPFPVEP